MLSFIALGLGSNRGDRIYFLEQSIQHLKEIITIEQLSSVYLSSPLFYLEQPDFYNIVLIGSTRLDPYVLLYHCQKIEKQLGRKKYIDKGPRNIDIDIIFYNNQIIDNNELTIPHPDYKNRLFVLEPMIECFQKKASIGTISKKLISNNYTLEVKEKLMQNQSIECLKNIKLAY